MGDVGLHAQRVEAQQDLRPREPLLVATADRDERTLGDEALGEGEAEAVGAAGDEKCPVLKFEVHGRILGMNVATQFIERREVVDDREVLCGDVGHCIALDVSARRVTAPRAVRDDARRRGARGHEQRRGERRAAALHVECGRCQRGPTREVVASGLSRRPEPVATPAPSLRRLRRTFARRHHGRQRDGRDVGDPRLRHALRQTVPDPSDGARCRTSRARTPPRWPPTTRRGSTVATP